MPQTPEEVAAAESEIVEAEIELPHSLRDPLAMLELAKNRTTVAMLPRAVVNGADADVFACAARNGNGISPEILQRMAEDEARARDGGEMSDAKK